MNSYCKENDPQSSCALDEINSSRKRTHSKISPRKSWNLMDQTDNEVLQEMGVSLLELDEGDCDDMNTINTHRSGLKHKLDIENINPNVNCNTVSPKSRYGSKSPKRRRISSPGPSRIRSPRSSEKLKALLASEVDNNGKVFIVDEETPLGQSVSADYKFNPVPSISKKSNKEEERHTSASVEVDRCVLLDGIFTENSGPDAFSLLSDEVMLGVFRWLPKRTLVKCMLVCKRWYRIASDETLWQRLDLGNRILSNDALGKILLRKPIIVRLATSEIGEWRPISPPVQSRLQYLDLSMASIDHQTLEHLLQCCSGLKKLSLENVRLSNMVQELIGKCQSLETLNLTMALGVTAEGLAAILKGCLCILSLNLAWCNLSEAALRVLVMQLPTKLQRLNISGARTLTDDMVSKLVTRCPRLLELDLSDCSQITVVSLKALLPLSRLEHLALSRCYQLPPQALVKLSSMSALHFLEIWGILQNTSLNALRAALPAMRINQFMFSAIARPTVGNRRTSIWGVRTRD